jgi:hypothetical protein
MKGNVRKSLLRLLSLVRRAGYHLTLTLLSILTVVFFVFLLRAWITQTQQPVTCQLQFGQLDNRNGYLEIQLTRQHPVEPYFEGQFFLLSVDPNDAAVGSVSVKRSAGRTYGISEHKTDGVGSGVERASVCLISAP